MSMTQSFTAHSRDGKRYTIHLISDENETSDRSGQSSTGRKLPTLRTADGWHMSAVSAKATIRSLKLGLLSSPQTPTRAS